MRAPYRRTGIVIGATLIAALAYWMARRGDGSPSPPTDAPRLLVDDTFADFAAGTLSEAGAKIYVAKSGDVRLVDQWDLDNDGHLDLVVTNQFDGKRAAIDSYVHWGGARGFADAAPARLATSFVAAATVADFDADGHSDIFFGNHGDGRTTRIASRIYFGNERRFVGGRRLDLQTVGATASSVADLDGNGYLDLVVSNQKDRVSDVPYEEVEGGNYRINSFVYWGGPEGYAATRRTELPTVGAIGNAIAGLGGDGRLDIVFANFTDGRRFELNSYVYWGGVGGPTASRRAELPTHGAFDVAIADYNRDGHLDVFFANQGDGEEVEVNSVLYWGARSGFDATRRTTLPTLAAHGASAADIDNDGHLDLVVSNLMTNDTVSVNSYVYWGSADGFSAAARAELPASAAVGNVVADFNRDGKLDVAFNRRVDGRERFAANTFVYWNAGGRRFERPPHELAAVGGVLGPTTDLGSVATRRGEHRFTSRILDRGPEPARCTALTARTRQPRGSSVTLQLRSAATSAALERAPWRGPHGGRSTYRASPADEAIAPNHHGHRFIQYRATLASRFGATPILDRVAIRCERVK